MTTPRPRVVLAEDSVLLREGLQRLLADAGFEVVDAVGDAEAFLRSVAEHAPDPEVVWQLLSRARRHDPLERLTPRESEVLGLMAEGRTNTAIAAAMVVTEGAVEKHVSSIFAKLDLPPTEHDHRRVLAVLRYLEHAGEDR